MAKFGRYDPRNKKRDRHKYQSLHRDIRIKEQRKSKKGYVQYDQSVIEYSHEDNGEYDEQFEQGDPYRL
jgi:hypothetical protein